MMSLIGRHLLMQGAEAYLKEGEVKMELPAWIIIMFATTAVVFVLILVMIEYTFGRLLPTLIMIESPQDDNVFEPLPTEDTDDAINKDPEQVAHPTPRFLTSTLRSFIQLLNSKGGFRSRFRGVSMWVVYTFTIQWVTKILSSFAGNFSGDFLTKFISSTIAMILCAHLSLGWTLIVISEPSPLPWYRRIPSIKLWKKIAVPTAFYAAAQHIAALVPMLLAITFGLGGDPKEIANMPTSEKVVMVIKGLVVLVLQLSLALLLVLPTNIVLTRVQASLLSDSEETIVPFDRTFGGKVVPEIIGGSGMVSMRDAWNTFDWAARVRLVKAYVKVTGMVFAVSILFATVACGQYLLFVGDIHKFIVPVDGGH